MTTSYRECAQDLFEAVFPGIIYWITDVDVVDNQVVISTIDHEAFAIDPDTIMRGFRQWTTVNSRDNVRASYRRYYDAFVNEDWFMLSCAGTDVTNLVLQYALFGELTYA